MSLTLNVLQFRAYISREEEVREILSMKEKLEKLKASLAKGLEENNKKLTRKGFVSGLFYQKSVSKKRGK